ncbi:hypothetical protein M426DRAFT_320114 [Hypoxylon sp. CI-4A]|nr:hypothetical protein M426DRAFT_320114 [Hypoxylon sp. CI-4A]
MGKTNRDSSSGDSRPSDHQSVKSRTNATPATPHPHPRSQSSQGTTYTMHGPSYFPHPFSLHCHDKSASGGSHKGTRTVSSSGSGGSDEIPRTSPILGRPKGTANPSLNAELKIALAAKHLADQIGESKKFWITFHESFEQEVASVRYYIDDDILQQIWQKRIEYNSKYRSGENNDDEEFTVQRVKLETCLDQVNEASRAFARSRPLGDQAEHDPRRLALEKIRGVGVLVLDLAAKSARNNGACADLVVEASNLEKLVDARSPDAKVLHQFDRRQSRRSASKITITKVYTPECADDGPAPTVPISSETVALDELGQGMETEME